MILLYLGLAVFGGGILALQLLAGHGADLDAGGAGLDVSGEAHPGAGLFLSLPFWSYASLGAGLCGLLCLGFELLGGWPLAGLAASLGAGCGVATSLAMRALRRGGVPAALDAGTVVGQVGRLRVAPRGQSPGQVRVRMGGQLVDLLAVSDDGALEADGQVVVVGVMGARVQVVRMEHLLAVRAPAGTMENLPSARARAEKDAGTGLRERGD